MVKEVRFEIGCADLESQLRFYRDTLEATVISQDEGFVVLELGGVKFSLWDASEQKSAQKLGLSLVINDRNEMKKRLSQERYVVTEWENCPMFLSLDGDGNGVSFMDDED
ncbi:MAG TPA: hypothetical protein PKV16_06120 [Caldisericia bacterium]|nr:hypothetical protein [Caldisericia bacterium]HPF49235.1 hypothetical protein [Caldisericia bacterium]HPI84085.1 hypothetical protein [Caldisericia bacterium]HPQ93343.1 hypothetical protein [Caldisericia bacterium]HRV75275.1 hypothetical protein [Caldisericia bacterium]